MGKEQILVLEEGEDAYTRVSFGRGTTEGEIDVALEVLAEMEGLEDGGRKLREPSQKTKRPLAKTQAAFGPE